MELIIYLEPNIEFKNKVEEFLKNIKEITTAIKYGCHVSMTGFFHVKQSTEFKEILDRVLNDYKFTDNVPQVDLKPLLVKKENVPIHLLLPVTFTDDYKRVMSILAEKCKEMVTLRLKRIDHISLAYWDEPNATLTQKSHWQTLVDQGIFDKIKQDADIYFQQVDSPNHWDVVLYERVLKGDLVGQVHEFKELGRWSRH